QASLAAIALFTIAAIAAPAARAAEFDNKATSLPFPPDAEKIEFTDWTGGIEYQSRSPLKSLAAFYLKEMTDRGWGLDPDDMEIDDETIELVFSQGEASVEAEFSQESGYVEVELDCDELDFSNVYDPASLAAAGLPVPPAVLFFQQKVPLPEGAQKVSYETDGCTFKCTLQLEEAYAHLTKAVASLGFRESRRPIISSGRNYTEFKKGPVEVSINVFSDPVGSRVILEHESPVAAKRAAPLPPVASLTDFLPKDSSGGSAAAEAAATLTRHPSSPESQAAAVAARRPADVTRNSGSATFQYGDRPYTFRHAAAFKNKGSADYATHMVFSNKPIPAGRLQEKLYTEEDFAFHQLYEWDGPETLIVTVGDYHSFGFSVSGVGIGRGVAEHVSTIEEKNGRIAGTFEMKPEEVLSRQCSFTAKINAVILTPETHIATGYEAPVETTADPMLANSPIPWPADAEDVSSTGSNYRKVHAALTNLPIDEAADHFRQALPEKGWIEGAATDDGSLLFANDAQEVIVKLEAKGAQTAIEATVLETALARKDGILTEPGKGRLVFGNTHTVPVVFTIGKTDYPLRPGKGAKGPQDALNYSVPPGTYKVVIKIPGEPEQTERVQLTAGSTWGVIALPTGGYMPVQMY
ncbi:MAG: hypothetical protein AAGA92_15930, partial [Planctomycetota bacterium]